MFSSVAKRGDMNQQEERGFGLSPLLFLWKRPVGFCLSKGLTRKLMFLFMLLLIYPTNCMFCLGIIQNLSTFEHFRRRSGYALP